MFVCLLNDIHKQMPENDGNIYMYIYVYIYTISNDTTFNTLLTLLISNS
jgi:hypothetical protein